MHDTASLWPFVSLLICARLSEWTSLVPIPCKLTGPVQFHGNFYWPLYRLISFRGLWLCSVDAVVGKMPSFEVTLAGAVWVNPLIKVVGQSFDCLRFKIMITTAIIFSLVYSNSAYHKYCMQLWNIFMIFKSVVGMWNCAGINSLYEFESCFAG